MLSAALWRENVRLPLMLVALLLAGGSILLETVFHVPVKLPGHRALPGALALLVLAESYGPLLLVAFAAAIPTTLVLLGHGQPWTVAVWVVPALVLVLLAQSRMSRSVIFFAVMGLLFGLLRYLSLLRGWHHTPELVRAVGHLCFGAGGGLAAFGVTRLIQPRPKEESL